MAHFAKLDENNIVTEVTVVANEFAPDEKTGQEFLNSIGKYGRWVQTSYNTINRIHHRFNGIPFRGKYAALGDYYDEQRDSFIVDNPPRSSWIWDEKTYSWKPGENYFWDKESFSWIENNK